MNLNIILIPTLPLLGFLILALFGTNIPKKVVALIGSGTVVISAFITLWVGTRFLSSVTATNNITVKLWDWINTAAFHADIAFRLDTLSLVFIFVITFVGALIHIYSIEFMYNDEGFARFFAYMNLFVGSMLILVLADNLLLLYLGWEGVGLCSYLLIGFWQYNPANGYAARKAFIITRIGDTAMIIGLFMLYIYTGTLNINDITQQAPLIWQSGSPVVLLIAFLLLGGALGKSAQLPLQTWLPDAMAGPSPVSALIHAATMVTAGVYLIARNHVLFQLAPVAQAAVAIIGAITLLIAGFSALTQHDLKRILAYSTISQIGYMFLALGVGAWSAAIFHFMIHAFFKALLFLAGGSVIFLLHEEHDIFKMGGLWKRMPVVFITFLIGSASLAALPFITAGFYSKDQILWLTLSSSHGSVWLYLAGLTGAFLTSLYTFRMVFVTFFGKLKTEPSHKPGYLMVIPLVVLAFLALVAGLVELPDNFVRSHQFSHIVDITLPVISLHHAAGSEFLFQVVASLISLIGIYLAYYFYMKRTDLANAFTHSKLGDFFYRGWGFDKLYDRLFVQPVVWLSEINKKDVIDLWNRAIGSVSLNISGLISFTQNGKLRWYTLALTVGIVLILTLMLKL